MKEKAVQIVKTLKKHGYIAYFAGGYVRDYLLSIPSDDIDIATDAPPEVLEKLFDKTVSVGKAFGVIVVVLGGNSFEVASFRKDGLYVDGRRPESIAYSTPQEDALRRDFTINGLFYDPLEDKIYDYVGGEKDLKEKLIRAIGDPKKRFEEDRLRIIRAIRFASRYSFPIEKETEEAIKLFVPTLFPAVAKERVWEELKKMAKHPSIGVALTNVKRLYILDTLFPSLKGMSLEEVEKRLTPLQSIERGIHIMAALALLMPDEKSTVFDSYNISTQEKAAFDYMVKYQHPPKTKLEKVKLFSNPLSEDLLLIHPDIKMDDTLKEPIDRMRKGRPLLQAKRLMDEGVAPGVKMGELLEEGEKIAIEKNLQTAEEVLKELKQGPFWP